jgi:hypothetical protein
MKTTKNTFAQFYALLKKMGIPQNDRRDFVMDYTDGLTDSLSELYNAHPHIYFAMIDYMEEKVKAHYDEMNGFRKRVIAGIFGVLESEGITGKSYDYVKAIACRVANKSNKSFNSLTKSDLQHVYNWAFKAQKINHSGDTELQRELSQLTFLN